MPPASDIPTYGDRLEERTRIWWSKDQSLGEKLHRLHELTRRHRPDDPDEGWRCCQLWQRTLQNKLNGKAFAEKHGARVPETYWSGRNIRGIPWKSLPDEVVVKPVWGFGGRGSYVISNGREQIKNVPMPRDQMIREVNALPRIPWVPRLVEEHVRRPDGSFGPPLEFKFHTFAGQVGAISTRRRDESTMGFYTPDWDLHPVAFTASRKPAPREAPDCLDEMLDLAARLGEAYGTYVRIDLFWTDQGCVFNEFATVPNGGWRISDYAGELLGDCWQRMLERYPADPSER